jgi:capsid protein
VDTGRDAIANRADIKAGLKTWTQHQLEMGNDPKAVARELFAEKAHFKELADEFDVQVSSAIMPENVAPADVDAAYQSDDEKEQAMMDDGEKVEADPNDPNVGPDPLNEPSDE